jgi:hypothetical protein
MPTGYTSAVQEGKATFQSYVWHVAQAFFHDGWIDEPAPSEEDVQASIAQEEKIQKEISKLQALSSEEIEKRFRAHCEAIREENQRYAERKRVIRERYEAMLVEVRAWTPPSPDHEALKKYMEEQLVQSIEFDCPQNPFLRGVPEADELHEWHADEIASRERTIQRSREQRENEAKHAARKRAYLEALTKSVGPNPRRNR